MNHQLYETWILQPEQLTGEQRGELEQHLAGCETCRKLCAGWQAVQPVLRAPEVLAPRAGFSRRWMAGAPERRLREQRRQAWRLFLSCGGAAAALLTGFVFYLLASTSPVEWIQAGVRVISSAVGLLGAFRDITLTWLHYTPPALNLALAISLAVTFCALTFVWVFALWRTSPGGAVQK